LSFGQTFCFLGIIEVYKIIVINGLRIVEVEALEKRQPTFAQMPNWITNDEFTTLRPTVATNMMWHFSSV
jgi:hypothetical protein